MTRVVAFPQPGPADLPFSLAAERNAAPILALLERWLPRNAAVLEVASGTGQHARHFAGAQPGWEWQPSEARDEALPALAARCADQLNVRVPLRLDVQVTPWPVRPDAFDAVYVANLLHIAPWEATPALLNGAARCLKHDGVLAVYGPFIVDDKPLAPSNAAFDADLRMRNAEWGLRALQRVADAAGEAGLVLTERCAMPANNLLLRFAVASRGQSRPAGTTPPPRLNPKKLLLSKWTAVEPLAKEKHFIVTRLVEPDDGGSPSPTMDVEIEAVHSGRSRVLAWRELTDTTRWRQGWK